MIGTFDNEFGKITITEDAIAMIAGYSAIENYGLVDMKAKSTSESLFELIEFFVGGNKKKGVKITACNDDMYDIDLYVKLIYGLSMGAVAKNIMENVKFRVQSITGIKIGHVNVHVQDVWVDSVD